MAIFHAIMAVLVVILLFPLGRTMVFIVLIMFFHLIDNIHSFYIENKK